MCIRDRDNPSREDTEKIIDQMMEGLDEEMKRRTLRITSRRDAIRTACTMAMPSDVILIAGKGDVYKRQLLENTDR